MKINLKILFCVVMLGICCSAIYAQRITITGTVVEPSGESIPGVTVMVKGTTTGTATDIDGKFTIDVPSTTAVLVFSFIGKTTVEQPVGNQRTLRITMADDQIRLGEVVVQTGYMYQKKADLTGSLALANAEDIARNPQANVMKSLQGKLPGVYITSDGNPAENVGIQIRGITSIRGADALVVVDGQPVNINFRDINTLDIESIQVLKDGASASIYGARAASGVILIETKKAKSGLKVSYDGRFGIEYLANMPRMLNTDQYGRLIWQATVNDGNDPAAAIRIYNYEWHRDTNGIPVLDRVAPVEWLNNQQTMPSADTDWFKEMTRPAPTNNHQLTVSSGTDRARSLYSLNFYEKQGTVIHSYFRRMTARMNSDYDLIQNRLKAGENFTVTYINLNGRSDVYNAIIMPSIVPVHTNDGGWGGTAMGLGMDDYNNPIRSLTLDRDNPDEFVKALGSAYLDLAILKNLHFKTQVGIDYGNYFQRHTRHLWEEGGGRQERENGVTSSDWKRFRHTWTNTLLYNLQLSNQSIDVLLGQESMRETYNSFSSYRSGLEIEDKDYAYINATTGDVRSQSGSGDEFAMLSYFGRVNYSLAQKYLLGVTVRWDGSSKFGANNRFGFFPSFSGGWRIKNESFLENVLWISDLKIRASWGKNGNDNIPSNALINIYDANFNNTSYPIAGNGTGTILSGYRRTHTGNPNLKWEATQQTDVGIDFGLFDQRLTGTVDYFYKRTNDMLFEPNYIGSFGEGGYQWINSADMENKGFDLLIAYNNGNKSDFQYTVTWVWSAYRNKVLSLPLNNLYNYGGNGLLDHVIGRPISSHYGLVADGLFKTQDEVDNSPEQSGKGLGRIRYRDLDGDGRINETYDRAWLGTRYPNFDGSLTFEATWKGFDVNLMFQGVFGNKVYNSWKEYSDFWNITVQNDKNHPVRIMDAWSFTNQNSDIPALSRANANQELRFNSYFLENGSYVKLRTFEIGYTLPRNFADKLFMQQCRFYVSGHNLLTFKKTWGDDRYTGPDPENPDFAYRIPLAFFVGLNVTF